jgi:hypothetical protein
MQWCSQFLCHGFCEPTHLQHIYFLKKTEKNKRAAPTHRTKTHAKKTA